MGLRAALRLRMLSRSAFFFEGFSMEGEFLAGLVAKATALTGAVDLDGTDFFSAAAFGFGLCTGLRAGLGAGLVDLAEDFLAAGFDFVAMGCFGLKKD